MRSLLLVAPIVVAAGCASHEAKNDYTSQRAAEPAPAVAATSASTARPAMQTNVQGNALHDPNSVLAKRSVYFDYDSNAIKPEYQPLIEAHSSFMASHDSTRVRIEGNCDERGSREYNLALGQRRAESMKHVMTALGVPASRIETVSYGEEKPAAMGHNEASWAGNRRDDLRYVAE